MADLSLDDFTAEVTAFLAANAQLKSEQRRFVWGEGPDSAALLREPDRAQEAVEIVAAKAWRAKRYDAGLGWIGGPKMYGATSSPTPTSAVTTSSRPATRSPTSPTSASALAWWRPPSTTTANRS